MRVTIVAWGRELAMEVGAQEPVVAIKRKLEQLLGIPAQVQVLSVFGWELMDGLDMEDYPIVTQGTRIDLTLNTLSSKFQITVKFSTRSINIEVERTETVRSLKEKIHIVESTPITRMSLSYSGVELAEDYRNLSEYGISEFSEINVTLKNMNRLKEGQPPTRRLDIVLQMSSSLINAATIHWEVKDSSTIDELRELLMSGKILPRDDYLFVHKQRIMRENCSLRWHGVENGDCLYVFRGSVSRGGGY